MKVLERAKTPEGMDIQIEDWKNDYSFVKTLWLGIYPIAKNTGSGYFDPRKGEAFRAAIEDFNNDNEVNELYNNLIEGKINLYDLSNRFRTTHTLSEIL
jgi:hypothetical protein